MDGKSLSNKEKLLKELRELVDTAQAIIASETNDVPKEYMGKQIDSANKIFANPNTYNEQAISIQISNLKMYVNAFKAQSTAIADSKKQYDSIIAEAKDILASNTLPDYDSVQNMQQLIDQMEAGMPNDEEVAALKPLMELSDAYTARAIENMNLMRRAIGLFDYQVPEVSDRRKAMTIVHALAEYEAGLIPKYQAYTHLGTVASKLIPTAIVQGTNENYYPSYNKYPNQS